MVKKLIPILLLGGITVGKAQIKLGAKGGIQLTNVTNYHGFSNSRLGIQFGAVAQLPLDDDERNYLHSEIVYLQHGETNDGPGIEEEFFINYISIPILLRRYITDDQNTIYAEGGMALAIKVSKDTTTNHAWPLFQNEQDEVSNFDISIGAGIGYSLSRELEFGFRYNYGLTDVYPKAIGEPTGKLNASSTLQFGITYFFN